jgi:hypothetical protein
MRAIAFDGGFVSIKNTFFNLLAMPTMRVVWDSNWEQLIFI